MNMSRHHFIERVFLRQAPAWAILAIALLATAWAWRAEQACLNVHQHAGIHHDSDIPRSDGLTLNPMHGRSTSMRTLGGGAVISLLLFGIVWRLSKTHT